jgi:hypothetical protein
MTHWAIENANYANDPRVRAANRKAWFESVDKSRMRATVILRWEDDEGEELERTVEVPIKFEICGTCQGKGTHVNPSIDSNGLSAEDFAEDPDFAEEYFGGTYDQTCNECGGDRVAPVIDESGVNAETRELLDMVMKQIQDDAEFESQCHAEYMAEVRMGA